MSVTNRQQGPAAEPEAFLREEKALAHLQEPLLEIVPALRLPIPEERSQEKKPGLAVTVVSAHDQWLALVGIRLQRLLCAELFREKAGVTAHGSPAVTVRPNTYSIFLARAAC
jgi:hypothetical protein